MTSKRKTARIAGLWYLAIAVFYLFGMAYGDSAFYVPGDVETTIGNILASRWLFRLSFVSCLAGHICFLFLANTLYKLLNPVDKDLARLMVIFVATGVAVAYLNRLNQLVPIILLNGENIFSAFTTKQSHDLAMLFLEIHRQGEIIVTVFWALWLLPLGLLVLKSDLIPKFLGIMLIATCLCYLVDFIVQSFSPDFMPYIKTPFSIIQTISEISFILWLLIKGVKGQETERIETGAL